MFGVVPWGRASRFFKTGFMMPGHGFHACPKWQVPSHPTTPPGDTMADIHIDREHTLGLQEARKIAFKWAEQAEADFGMECTYEEGENSDLVSFSRTGVNGTLSVTGSGFELDARLGFLLGAFREKIEAEIVKNLDELISRKAAAPKAAAKKAAARKKIA